MRRKGQSTLEYAVIIAVVVAGLLAMQTYMKRAVQGKLRQSTDSIGEQYSAGRMVSNSTTTYGVRQTKETFGLAGGTFTKGVSRSQVISIADTTRSTTETLGDNLSAESLFK